MRMDIFFWKASPSGFSLINVLFSSTVYVLTHMSRLDIRLSFPTMVLQLEEWSKITLYFQEENAEIHLDNVSFLTYGGLNDWNSNQIDVYISNPDLPRWVFILNNPRFPCVIINVSKFKDKHFFLSGILWKCCDFGFDWNQWNHHQFYILCPIFVKEKGTKLL